MLLLDFPSNCYSNDTKYFENKTETLSYIYNSYGKIKDTLKSEHVIETYCSDKCLGYL